MGVNFTLNYKRTVNIELKQKNYKRKVANWQLLSIEFPPSRYHNRANKIPQ